MKKLSALFLAAALLFALGSCGETKREILTSETDTELISALCEPTAEAAIIIEPTGELTTAAAVTTAAQATSATATVATSEIEQATQPTATKAQTTAATTVKETTSAPKNEQSVSLFIGCETILDNMKKLKKGKESFVPSDGIILPVTHAEFKEGDTAFDVLCALCKTNNIPLEYEFTPGFKTYYIEGINMLYEKDCGSRSGWLYRVNGQLPSVGASEYTLKNGDRIEFLYTCSLGDDIDG